MIRLVELTKRFGRTVAVDRLNLQVKRGELFGFLGPNAAGKTTTIRMLAGVLSPTSGTVLIDDLDLYRHPLQVKRRVGFIPDRPYLYEKLSGGEFLRFVADLYGVDGGERQRRIAELLEFFELTPWANELVEGYSHGMKQKLAMSAALLHHPQVLIVDEPMVGLDPKTSRLVKAHFKELCRGGVTIFMSTHTLSLAEEVCDRIAIIHNGQLLAIGTMQELREAARDDSQRLEPIFLKLTASAPGVEVEMPTPSSHKR